MKTVEFVCIPKGLGGGSAGGVLVWHAQSLELSPWHGIIQHGGILCHPST